MPQLLNRAEFFWITLKTENEGLQTFKNLCIEYYESKGKSLATNEDFEVVLLYEAYAAMSLSHPKLVSQGGILSMSIAEIYMTGVEESFEGNGLTYIQAFLFVRDLTEKVGLEKMLLYCLGEEELDFEAELGTTLSEALAEFRAKYTA